MAIEKIIAYSVLLCSAFFVGKILEGVLFIVPFLVLRQMTGGFHAKTIWGCLVGSTITMLLALQIICPLVEKHEIVYGILFFLSIVCIICFAPVNHPNLMLTEEEQKHLRLQSRIVLGIEIGIITIGYILHMRWQQYIVIAIIICAVFILLSKLLRQDVLKDEEK